MFKISDFQVKVHIYPILFSSEDCQKIKAFIIDQLGQLKVKEPLNTKLQLEGKAFRSQPTAVNTSCSIAPIETEGKSKPGILANLLRTTPNLENKQKARIKSYQENPNLSKKISEAIKQHSQSPEIRQSMSNRMRSY